jgi:flagellar biosynthesis protein FlhB
LEKIGSHRPERFAERAAVRRAERAVVEGNSAAGSEAMTAFRILAGLLMVLSAATATFSFLGAMESMRPGVAPDVLGFAVFAAALMVLVFSAILWVLTVIAEHTMPKPAADKSTDSPLQAAPTWGPNH